MGGGWYTVFLENNACARQFEFTERKAAIRLGVTLPVADSFSWKHTQEEQKHPARHPLSPFTTGNATEQISTGKESKKYYSGLIIYSTYKYFSKKNNNIQSLTNYDGLFQDTMRATSFVRDHTTYTAHFGPSSSVSESLPVWPINPNS